MGVAPADGWWVEGEGTDDVMYRESIRRDRGQEDEGGEMTGTGGREGGMEGGASREHGPIT